MTDWGAARACAERAAGQWAQNEPGGAIIGFDRNGVRFSVCQGLSSLTTGARFTEISVGRFASVTKHVFCAMAVAHGDVLELDAPLGRFLPELNPQPGRVAVRQALSMTGGIPDTRETLALHGLTREDQTQADALLAYMARLDRLNFEPGTALSYSNGGYRLVEAALERLGYRFDDFVRDRIADPLGIGLRAMQYWQDPAPGLIPGYGCVEGQWRALDQGMHLSAAGSLVGSLADLVTWIVKGLWSDLDRLGAPQRLLDGRLTGYGLGLRWIEIGGVLLVGHGGSQPGFRSGFLMSPQSGEGIAVLSNRDDADAGGIVEATMAALLGAGSPEPIAPQWAPPGLYLAEGQPLWAEVKPSSIVVLGAEERLYAQEGWAVSRSATSPIRLRFSQGGLEGEIGHAPVRLLRAGNATLGPLEGLWLSPSENAMFRIVEGAVIWGAGAQAQRAPLTALDPDHGLFSLHDGSGIRTILLHRLDDRTVTLSVDRSRGVPFERYRA